MIKTCNSGCMTLTLQLDKYTLCEMKVLYCIVQYIRMQGIHISSSIIHDVKWSSEVVFADHWSHFNARGSSSSGWNTTLFFLSHHRWGKHCPRLSNNMKLSVSLSTFIIDTVLYVIVPFCKRHKCIADLTTHKATPQMAKVARAVGNCRSHPKSTRKGEWLAQQFL
jgi:hypothetical protein